MKTAKLYLVTLFTALAASSCQPTQAGTIGAHLLSYHTDTETGWNNINLGAYYRTDSGYQVGAYYNSLHKPTLYAAKVFESGRYGLALGLATGYKGATGLGVVPMVAPTVKLTDNLRLTVMPTYSRKTGNYGAVFHTSWEF